MKQITRLLIPILAVACIGCRPANDRLATPTPTPGSAALSPSPATSAGAGQTLTSPTAVTSSNTATSVSTTTSTTTAQVSTTTTTNPNPLPHVDTAGLDQTLADLDALLEEISNELAGVSAALNEGE